ncbi:MAG: type II toxin-antitoxin system RelE/ParE family toxin [Endomicrobium sp.]|jgi:putative addiction module killer protein|nr:type II toxin-antitoxin system RelE/ParE family toxin [Endomicrobium sp.]
MIIRRTECFAKWFKKLDMYIRVRLLMHINKLENGNFSNAKSVGGGVHELKIDFQKGYRIYFANVNGEIIILLCGGDKSSQQCDIAKAKEIKKNL